MNIPPLGPFCKSAVKSTALALICAGAAVVSLQAEPVPGQPFHLKASDLPPPYATPSTSNTASRVRMQKGQKPLAPDGFKVELAAAGLEHPRQLLAMPSGDLLVAQSSADEVTLLRDDDGDGVFDRQAVFAAGLDRPFGLALLGSDVWFADLDGVWRLPYDPATGLAKGKPKMVTAPRALGPTGGHWTRNLALHPSGKKFYVAIGSRGNIAVEKEPRATIREFPMTGGPGRTYGAGLRNPVGLAFLPGTDRLFTVVNERDGMGDDLVPDYLTEVRDGDFFGWPYAYTGTIPQPDFADRRPDLVDKSRLPDVLFQSHSAPIGMVFYDGTQFPEAYRGDAFVALHGSWNSSVPRGYFVARVPFDGGNPSGGYEAFLTGFLNKKGKAWGRPAGLAVDRNGDLLVSEDRSGTIWRVSVQK